MVGPDGTVAVGASTRRAIRRRPPPPHHRLLRPDPERTVQTWVNAAGEGPPMGSRREPGIPDLERSMAMGIVTADISVTLDGYGAGPNQRLEAPFGDLDEEGLHSWQFDHADENAAEVAAITEA